MLAENLNLNNASNRLQNSARESLTNDMRALSAISLAAELLSQANNVQSTQEKMAQAQLGRMMDDYKIWFA